MVEISLLPSNVTDVEVSAARSSSDQRKRPSKQRRWLTLAVMLVVVAFLLIAALPTIIVNTPFKNRLLAAALSDKEVEATVHRAQLSWFAPISLSQLQINSRENKSRASIETVSSNSGLFSWLFAAGSRKSVIVKELNLLVDVASTKTDDEKAAAAAALAALIDDAAAAKIAISLRDSSVSLTGEGFPEPTVALTHVNLDGRLLRSESHTLLVIEPGQIIDQARVSPELCDAALKYVAPVLANTTWADGTLSFELDKCHISLGDPQATECSGLLTIHSLQSGVKSPLALEIGELISRALGKELPTKVKLADNSQISFAIREGRVWHEGLEFGLPEISPELVIRTSGTVGLDQTLDLMVEVPLPLQLLGDGLIAEALGKQTLKLLVRGTLDDPRIEFQQDGKVVSELLGQLSAKVANGDLDLSQLIDQIRQLRGRPDADAPTILDRWRERREERQPIFRRRR